MKTMELTAVKDELEFYEFHIYQIGVDRLVRHTHTNVLDFDDITLKGVLQPLVK